MQEALRTPQGQTAEPAEPLMTSEEVAAYLAVPIATLYRWRRIGQGPRSFRVGRHGRYRREDVERWLEERARS